MWFYKKFKIKFKKYAINFADIFGAGQIENK